MTPENEAFLSEILDSQTQHSAARQWGETLPPEIQERITDKRPRWQDREVVSRRSGVMIEKIREKNTPTGEEIEDGFMQAPRRPYL